MTSALRLERTRQHGGLEVWQADLGAMPMPQTQRPALAAWLTSLLHEASSRYGLTETVWLEATHIHVDGATRLLAPNARAWVPKTGFGIHPDGEPPRMWTDDDFSGAAFGTQLPVFNNQVFEISRADGHASAIEAMAGCGLLILTAMSGSVDQFKQEMQTVLGSVVRERAFHAYSFFFPLLSANSAGSQQVVSWMGNASVYIREVFDSKSLLILARVPLEPCLAALQAQRTDNGIWEWKSGGALK